MGAFLGFKKQNTKGGKEAMRQMCSAAFCIPWAMKEAAAEQGKATGYCLVTCAMSSGHLVGGVLN